MFKKMVFSLLFLSHSLFASDNLPTNINFSEYPTIESYYTTFNHEVWKFGGYAFNLAPELSSFFGFLKQNYRIDTAVETGTFMGGTTIAFAYLFKNVHTIEIEPTNYNLSKNMLSTCSNVSCHLGNSSDVLKEILPTLKGKRVLFYLDAHWQQYWPLLDEIELISKTHKNHCIIVIDDFKVPGRSDIVYDSYGNDECSIEYVKNKLDKVFTSYQVHYLIPKSIHCRAKLVVIPTKWN